MNDRIVIAIYMRLSQDDGDLEAESRSIVNQRHQLHTYVAKNFHNYELLEFQDDGYTGTNFNRPGVSKLLNQVKRGEINCIVVKDLSRFSRDYIEMGAYLEQIFPFAGVRFIAINDRYDSNQYIGKVAGLDASFKNLLNDLYCKDISTKVKSSLAIKKENGIYANGSCTFGYRKDKNDRHVLRIVEEEAAVVRRIFQMTMEGISSHKIAKRFNAEGIKTPIEYKMERGIATMTPKGEHFEWNASTICQMLRNATYVGDFVYDKYETLEVSGKSRLKPRSEWKVYKNHHEAIIDRTMFERIQQNRGVKHAVKNKRHPLIGKMVCGCCYKSLQIERNKNPYFFCKNKYTTCDEGCVAQINVQFLEQYILFKLQAEIDEQKDMNMDYTDIKHQIEQQMAEAYEEKNQNIARLERFQKMQVQMYEAYVYKKIGKEEYQQGKKKLDYDKEECEKLLIELNDRIKKLKRDVCMEEPEVWEYIRNHSFTEITQDIVNKFLKKVVIYDEKHIEIEWNFSKQLPKRLWQYQFVMI